MLGCHLVPYPTQGKPGAQMTPAIFCILLAAIMPIVCAGLAKRGAFGIPRSQGGYDNLDPRGWLERQEGARKWANNAQANSWEALPFFGLAVLSTHLLVGPTLLANVLAVSFIVLRALYVYLYVTGKQAARSGVWTLAFAANVAIFLIPVFR
ncbi:hypothetical protein IP84_10695 [beta proteobacterium AAP99]|nr:hypothetical protein IP84_10695 [beta proteobacterium AAP99]